MFDCRSHEHIPMPSHAISRSHRCEEMRSAQFMGSNFFAAISFFPQKQHTTACNTEPNRTEPNHVGLQSACAHATIHFREVVYSSVCPSLSHVSVLLGVRCVFVCVCVSSSSVLLLSSVVCFLVYLLDVMRSSSIASCSFFIFFLHFGGLASGFLLMYTARVHFMQPAVGLPIHSSIVSQTMYTRRRRRRMAQVSILSTF